MAPLPDPREPWELSFDAPFPLAPAVGTSIEGINFDEDSLNSGFFHIPPDPIGAAGPDHVVSLVNTSIEWHTKEGVNQLSQKLGPSPGSFFDPLTPVNNTFDPKVIFDAAAGRFIVVSLERNDTGAPSPGPANTSRILVAVSDDADPNGTWYFLAINSKTTSAGIERWADYPGLAVDEEAIYITANLFSFSADGQDFGGVRLWIIDKATLYAGTGGSFTVHDPYADGGFATTTQPAMVLGSPPAGSIGTYLVVYSGLSNSVDEFLQIFRVDNPLAAPTFLGPQFINVGNIENFTSFPDATQNGTTTRIETNDRRALNAVWRNNRLWTTSTIVPFSGPDSGQVTAHWWELNTASPGALTLIQQGDVGGEDAAAGAQTFFSSITVDAFNNMAIGFSISAPGIYPGAAYTGRLATAPAGTTQPVVIFAPGVDYYVRTFGGTRNRWGDYSGISLDPSESSTFWVFNVYALARGTVFGEEDGRWGTRWGKFSFIPVLPAIDSFEVVNGHDFEIRFTTVAGQDYEVEQSEALESGPWTGISTGIAGDGTIKAVIHTDALDLPKSFYRVSTTFPIP